MENLVLVLWVCLWPISSSIDRFINVNTDNLLGHNQLKESDKHLANMLSVIIWIIGITYLINQ